MPASSTAAPQLRMECVVLTDEATRWSLLDLLTRTSPSQPLTWIRNGEGYIGAGRLLRLAFRGEHRFADAARAWQVLSETAEIDDRVQLPGSGLIAFGAFSFSAESEAESVLIVPEFVFGQRDGVAWVSRMVDATSLPAEVALEGELEVSFHEGLMSESEFLRAVNTAQSSIHADSLEKVVLSRDLIGTLPEGADLRLAISKLAHLYADCFTFAIDGILGASPETLAQVYSGAVSGRILAGTASRGDTPPLDVQARDNLLASEKDLAEHAFAVSSVAERLGDFTNTVSLGTNPFAVELPNVWHLATDFTAELNENATVLDVVSALHPTAAVAGSPSETAVALINTLEPFDRGRYAGPVGWLDANGNGEWGIALRCAQVTGTTVTAFAGGGIVADSVADDELVETTVKFEPILRAFNPN